MSKIIRTKTRAEGGITADERKALSAISERAIKAAFRTEPADFCKLEKAIHALYACAGLRHPRVVLVPSPMVMAYAYGASAAIWHVRKSNAATHEATTAATRAATHEATDVATDAATRAATYEATYEATDVTTRAATHAATNAATYEATGVAEMQAANACRRLAGEFGVMCAYRWYNSYQGGSMWAGVKAYLEGFRDVIGLRLPEYEKGQIWLDCMEGGFRVMHEEFCIASDHPEYIKIDDQNRPHCEDGPSHRWRDGWSIYHWHGVRVPAQWIENKARLSAQEALSQENAELRRAACEIVGWARILKELNATTINEHENPQIGRLVEVDLPDAPKERFLVVQCGTGRQFALPVPPQIKTALAAQAWTYGLDESEFTTPEVRT